MWAYGEKSGMNKCAGFFDKSKVLMEMGREVFPIEMYQAFMFSFFSWTRKKNRKENTKAK